LEAAMESRRLAGEDGLPKPRSTIEMLVPGAKISNLLGAQGETLKKIERTTNTKISIDQSKEL
jgi:rRNA processing protein Krr1/Pno1